MRTCYLLLVVIILLHLISCSSPKYYIYAPSPPVNPFFKEKGDSKASAYISAASAISDPGIDLQAAYALTDHIAVTGSFSGRREINRYPKNGIFVLTPQDQDSFTNNYKRKMGEVGIGYFSFISSKKRSTFNIYGGYGWGKFWLNETGKSSRMGGDYTRAYETGFRKWYIQPSLHLMPNRGRYICIGFVTKFSIVNYNQIQTSYSNDELKDRNLHNVPTFTYLFFEPSVNFQFSFPPPWFKLGLDVTFCPLYGSTSSGGNDLRQRFINASFGITFDLAKIGSREK